MVGDPARAGLPVPVRAGSRNRRDGTRVIPERKVCRVTTVDSEARDSGTRDGEWWALPSEIAEWRVAGESVSIMVPIAGDVCGGCAVERGSAGDGGSGALSVWVRSRTVGAVRWP